MCFFTEAQYWHYRLRLKLIFMQILSLSLLILFAISHDGDIAVFWPPQVHFSVELL